MKRSPQSGFAALELLLIVVVIGIIAFVAWRVIDANGSVQEAANSVPQTVVVPESSAPAVTPANANDLSTLEKQIDNTAIDDTATSQLDTQSTF